MNLFSLVFNGVTFVIIIAEGIVAMTTVVYKRNFLRTYKKENFMFPVGAPQQSAPLSKHDEQSSTSLTAQFAPHLARCCCFRIYLHPTRTAFALFTRVNCRVLQTINNGFMLWIFSPSDTSRCSRCLWVCVEGKGGHKGGEGNK